MTTAVVVSDMRTRKAAAGVIIARMNVASLSHLGATKAWAPAAPATAMIADFIFELGGVVRGLEVEVGCSVGL